MFGAGVIVGVVGAVILGRGMWLVVMARTERLVPAEKQRAERVAIQVAPIGVLICAIAAVLLLLGSS